MRFVLLYNSKKSGAGVVTNTYRTCTTAVAIVAGRSVSKSIYSVSFTLPYNDGTYPIAFGSEIAGILRRAAAGGAREIDDEAVIIDQRITYHCDEVYKQVTP